MLPVRNGNRFRSRPENISGQERRPCGLLFGLTVRCSRYRFVFPSPRCVISSRSAASSSFRYVRTLRSVAPISSASVTWPGKHASLFHAYLSNIAYASFAPTEMLQFVRMKFGTWVKPWRVARSAPTISIFLSLRMSPMWRSCEKFMPVQYTLRATRYPLLFPIFSVRWRRNVFRSQLSIRSKSKRDRPRHAATAKLAGRLHRWWMGLHHIFTN